MHVFLYLCSRDKVNIALILDVKTNPKKWLVPVLIRALVVAVVLLAVALNYAVRAERHDYTKSTWDVQGFKEKESSWSVPIVVKK